jgi:hypothetical protein
LKYPAGCTPELGDACGVFGLSGVDSEILGDGTVVRGPLDGDGESFSDSQLFGGLSANGTNLPEPLTNCSRKGTLGIGQARLDEFSIGGGFPDGRSSRGVGGFGKTGGFMGFGGTGGGGVGIHGSSYGRFGVWGMFCWGTTQPGGNSIAFCRPVCE